MDGGLIFLIVMIIWVAVIAIFTKEIIKSPISKIPGGIKWLFFKESDETLIRWTKIMCFIILVFLLLFLFGLLSGYLKPS